MMTDTKASRGKEGESIEGGDRRLPSSRRKALRLFVGARLVVGDVERELGRLLGGDPSRGERGVVAALGDKKLDEARALLDHDPTLGADFKALVDKRIAAAQSRPGRAWRVQLPAEIWDEYAREAGARGIPIGECLSAAIDRDSQTRRASGGAGSQALDVAACIRTAVVVLAEGVRMVRGANPDDMERCLGGVRAALESGELDGRPRESWT